LLTGSLPSRAEDEPESSYRHRLQKQLQSDEQIPSSLVQICLGLLSEKEEARQVHVFSLKAYCTETIEHSGLASIEQRLIRLVAAVRKGTIEIERSVDLAAAPAFADTVLRKPAKANGVLSDDTPLLSARRGATNLLVSEAGASKSTPRPAAALPWYVMIALAALGVAIALALFEFLGTQ
jgi:hypothetical protein